MKIGEVTNLPVERQSYLYDALVPALQQMLADELEVLEYGDPFSIPGAYKSYLRIKRINTPGGKQFRVCELFHGSEGGGAYFHDVFDAARYAMALIRHYHRPLPAFIQERRVYQEDLDWFAFKASDPVAAPIRALANAKGVAEWLPEGVSVNLEQP